MSQKTVQIGSHTIEISHPDKLFYPKDKISKADVVDYYRQVAETMLPHLQEYPLNMQRFPDGIDGVNFYEKAIPDYFPEWIDRVAVTVKESGKKQDQVVCNNAGTLVYLADQACLTSHTWLSRASRLDRSDKLIFDLDPPGDDFELVRFAARTLAKILDEVGLSSFLMTTGSRGLHVVVPLDGSVDFDDARAFARDLADLLAQREPKRLTTEVRKNQRKGRLFLDYLRNAYGQTSVPPYALRALPGAPVAAPLDWDELDDPDLDSQSYTLGNLFRRLGQKDDPWKDIRAHAVDLASHRDMLDKLMAEAG